MTSKLKAYVIVATKGRPEDAAILKRQLLKQTSLPECILFVGTRADDFEVQDLANPSLRVKYLISLQSGLPIQRNLGVDHVLGVQGNNDDFIIIYFDDDFRPKKNWIEQALICFSEHNIVGLTGKILADGINGPGISEEVSRQYLQGDLTPMAHWTNRYLDKEVESAYGCNMAFSARASRALRFDENLPAYGWLEDKDYSLLCKKIGMVRCESACKGVHLGTKRGRVSEIKLGYSQIANPLFLMKKGSLSVSESILLAMKNVLANHAKFFFSEPWVDRKGRVKGNWLALADLLKRRLHPQKINDL